MKKYYRLEDFKVGNIYKITYISVSNEKTVRFITILRNKHNLQCYCHLRKALRNFNITLIKKAKEIVCLKMQK
jgi:predicted DNA-binding transcriptional regulator YafY